MTDIFLNAIYGKEMQDNANAIEAIDDDIEKLQISKAELKRKIGKIDTSIEKLEQNRILMKQERDHVLATVLDKALSGQCIAISTGSIQYFGFIRTVVLGGKPTSPILVFYFSKVGRYDSKNRMVLDNQTSMIVSTHLQSLKQSIRMANDEEKNDLNDIKN